MSVSEAHILYDIGIGVEATPTMLPGLTRQDASSDPTVRAALTGNRVDPRVVAITQQEARGTFSHLAIGAVIDALGLDGYNVDVDESPAQQLMFYLANVVTGKQVEAGANHIRYTANRGIIVPDTLTVGATHLEDAVITHRYVLVKSGAVLPWVKTEDVALPTPEEDNQRYTIGPIALAGYTHTGLRRMTMSFNVQVVEERADNDTFPTLAYFAGRHIQIELVGVDPKWFTAANIPLGGTTALHADSYIYLRKWDPAGAGFIDDEPGEGGTAEHIKFTLNGVVAVSQPFSVNVGGISETAVRLFTADDGSNGPLTVDTTAAIT